MTSSQHLYGQEDDEVLEFDWFDVYDRWIDLEEVEDPERLTAAEITSIGERHAERAPDGSIGFAICQWDSAPMSQFLYRSDRVIATIMESLANDDLTEHAWDAIERQSRSIETDPAAIAAFDVALGVLGEVLDRKVPYRMARRLVATHWVTFDDEGHPLFDGERIFPDRGE